MVEIPNGWTLEQLDRYARERLNAQRRECYARHPERVMAQRLRSAKSLLERNGKLVIPQPPPEPWSDLQSSMILQAVRAAMEDQQG